MTEPLYKRARRPDSKQMWDESDRRAPIPSRERDEPREREKRDDRSRDGGWRDRDRGKERAGAEKERDRDRRYRSRSPRDSRDSRGGRDRDRGARRDDLDTRDSRGGGRDGRDSRDERGGRRRDEDRNGAGRGGSYRGEYSVEHGALSYRMRSNVIQESGRDARDRPRERSRSRDRRRSRSPRRDRDDRREKDSDSRHTEMGKGVEKPSAKTAEADFIKSRTATPPVSFKVGRATSHDVQDHDRMDTDDDTKPFQVKGGAKAKKARSPEPVEDEDIVIEDDGMAAMQAMMGFGGFATTHNKKIPGNDVSAVRKEKKTEYRQYMNRVGGFNRPLSPSHD